MTGPLLDSVTHLYTRTWVAIQNMFRKCHEFILLNFCSRQSHELIKLPFPYSGQTGVEESESLWSCASLPEVNLDQPHRSVTVHLENSNLSSGKVTKGGGDRHSLPQLDLCCQTEIQRWGHEIRIQIANSISTVRELIASCHPMLIASSFSFYAAIIAVPLNSNDSSNDGNCSGWRCWAQSARVAVLCRAIVISIEELYS